MSRQSLMIQNALAFAVAHTDRWPEVQSDYREALKQHLREQEPPLLTEDELKELIHIKRNEVNYENFKSF